MSSSHTKVPPLVSSQALTQAYSTTKILVRTTNAYILKGAEVKGNYILPGAA